MEPGQLHQILQPKLTEIRKYLIRMGANPADAEDIVQDTVYKAFLYMESIEANKLSAWLYKVAINRYYDLCRRNKWIQVSIDSVEIPDLDLPEDNLLQKEERAEVELVLSELLPHHKEILIMKYELELSYREISDMLGVKVENVKSRLYQARQQFQIKYRGDVE